MKAKLNLTAAVSRLCVAILAFLGYSCDNITGDMYGTPTGSWEIKGAVTDEAVEPVADATVKVTFPTTNSSEYSIVETRTNEKGEYYAKETGPSSSSLKVVCIPDDPELKADSTIVNLKYSGGNKKDEWDEGTAHATVNFKLKKRSN